MRKLVAFLLALVAPAIAAAQGGTPAGAYGPSSGSSANSNAVGGGVSPLSFGAKWDVRFEGDCTFVNNSQTVSCAQGPFSAADVGKIEFGTCGTTQVNPNMLTAGGLIVPQGIITGFTNSTTVTVSLAANANCTPSNAVSGNFAWGTQDDTAALNAAMTAAWNTIGAKCVLELPAGAMFFSSAILSGPANNQCMGAPANTGVQADLTSAGPVVFGLGPAATVLIPLPSFNFASCTNGSGSTCVGGTGNLHVHDLGINGLQQPLGSAHAVNLFEVFGQNNGGGCDGGNSTWNLALSGWGLTANSSTGFLAGINLCNDSTMWNINVSAFGSTPCHITPNNILNAYGLFCFGAQANVLELDGGTRTAGTFNSYGGQYLAPLNTNFAAIHCNNSGSFTPTMNSWGDLAGSVNGAPAQNSALICNGQSGNFNFHNSNLFVPSGTTGASQVVFLSGTSVIHADHTIFNASGGANNHILTSSATDKFFDDGGNAFTAGGAADSISGPVFGTLSATGTALTTGNIGLTSGWGTSSVASVATGSDSHRGRFTITGAAGAASPTLTLTFPTPYPLIAPASCTLIFDSAGAFTDFTNVSAGTPTKTSVLFTFTGTPTAVSIVLDYQCGP